MGGLASEADPEPRLGDLYDLYNKTNTSGIGRIEGMEEVNSSSSVG